LSSMSSKGWCLDHENIFMSLSLHTTKIHFPPDCREFGITVTLKPHQTNLQIEHMGLGKTLEAIDYESHFVSQWDRLLKDLSFERNGWLGVRDKRFTPEHEVLRYESLLLFSVLFTTYDIALLDQHFLSQILWQYTVIDEAQILKNPNRLSRKRWE
ncbi:hypothetical protein HID58_066687, partial [Brassica napus]